MRGIRSVQQGLIKWSSSPESLATWEVLELLRQRFPAALAWGQAAPKEGGLLLIQLLWLASWRVKEGFKSVEVAIGPVQE
jgi:hypothetical protein